MEIENNTNSITTNFFFIFILLFYQKNVILKENNFGYSFKPETGKSPWQIQMNAIHPLRVDKSGCQP
jgi:hypothetical protein